MSRLFTFNRSSRWLDRRLLIIWDGLKAHRSRFVCRYVEASQGAIWLAFLPAYALELNSAEYAWGHRQQHEIGNCRPDDLAQLDWFARDRLRSMPRRRTLVMAFWKQAELPRSRAFTYLGGARGRLSP